MRRLDVRLKVCILADLLNMLHECALSNVSPTLYNLKVSLSTVLINGIGVR